MSYGSRLFSILGQMSAIAFWRGVENAKKAAKGSTQMYEN
jgi:hypothetical protein